MHVLGIIAIVILAIAALAGVAFFARWRNGGLWPWQDSAPATRPVAGPPPKGTQATK